MHSNSQSEILDSLPCGFLSFAEDGKILSINQSLLDVLGLARGGVEGAHVETLFSVASKIFLQTHFLPLLNLAGHAEEIYLALRSSSGAEIPVLINATRRVTPEVTRTDCIVVQMGRRNLYENELLQAKRQLTVANAEISRHRTSLEIKQAELETRYRDLDALRNQLEVRVTSRTNELERVLADLESFTYSLAHDLRAPLRAIISTSMVLSEELAEKMNEEQLELLRRQSFNGRKLAGLIDDLLLFARTSRKKPDYETVSISLIAERLALTVGLPADGSGPEITVEPGMTASCDVELVTHLLKHLLRNAVNYSPQGGSIHVGRRQTNRGDTFYVEDHGIGLEMVYAQKIFLPFERLHRDGEFEGNGIGLALAKRFVDLHGGSIWVESDPGKGATFFFALPTPPESDLPVA